jgi:hypothetical protein
MLFAADLYVVSLHSDDNKLTCCGRCVKGVLLSEGHDHIRGQAIPIIHM